MLKLKNVKTFIDNRLMLSTKKQMPKFPVHDPADDSVIIEVPDMSPSDAKTFIQFALDTFKTWSEVTAKERATIIRNWFYTCQKNTEYLSEIITSESGKPLIEARQEVAYGNSFLEWYADCARHINGEIIQSPWPHKRIMHTRHPVGVVSVIIPWNFPFAMMTRKVGALMAAGCTCVIKPSEDTPLTVLAAVELAEKSGVPKGVINVVTTSHSNSKAVGSLMCEDDDVHCISFTGSTAVGKQLYKYAAKRIKRIVLELGGNAPFIVMESADLEYALDQAMLAKFRNNGQTCVAANRFLIHEKIYKKFVCGFKDRIEKLIVLGPGKKKGVTCGPLINMKQAKFISSLVTEAVSQGACLVLGGEFAKELGNKFYKPTILMDVTPDMKIFQQEIFGPVVQVTKIKNEEEALRLANNVHGGLASYIFTKDIGQALRIARKLDYGMVAINDGILSTPEAAFGGTKETGIGSEGSLHGALDYTDLKYTLMGGIDR